MTVLVVLLVAIPLASIILLAFLVKNSTEGWQDDEGFHFGSQGKP